MSYKTLSLLVPDVESTPHENTFLHRKQNHKWVKLKSY